MKAAALTAAALVCFAANSLLCRAALKPGLIDPETFTLVRIASGAILLGALAARRRSGGGTTLSAMALFAYAICFSLAYRLLAAGTGALILFCAVQATMIGWSFRSARPRALEWAGLAVSLAGLVVLTFPGLESPDATGAALMAGAGISWGAYTLRGKGIADPLAATAGNFLRATPFALLPPLLAIAHAHVTPEGFVLAAISGAITSGVGYAVWYAALPSLSPVRAAVLQLAVPVLAALGAVPTLGESLTPRLLIAAPIILGGIALTLVKKPQTTG